jgi:putative two-component system response regulator
MYTVLIVDDAVENIDVLKGVLKDDYNIKVATNGQTALKVAEKTIPDIILLDIMMPEMDGYEVCSLLKKNPITGQIPIIFITAKDRENDEVKGFEVGAADYINKPIRPTVTKARIRTHIALSDQKRALGLQVQEQTREITRTRLEIIKKLGRAAEYKDNETGLHIERISKYAYYIAKALGLEDRQADLILQASPMHDIGKIGIPDEILKKPGKLDPEEWAFVVKHPEIGADILGDSEVPLLQSARIIALQHHERWDGAGYPGNLFGEQIHLFARITAVADVFDALTSKRPYKSEWPVEQAIDYLHEQRNRHFDQRIVEVFLRVLPILLEVKKQFAEG